MSVLNNRHKMTPDDIAIGLEPSGVIITNTDYTHALNWYTYKFTVDDLVKFLYQFMNRAGYELSEINKINKLATTKISIEVCSIAKMLLNDVILPETAETHLRQKISEYLQIAVKDDAEEANLKAEKAWQRKQALKDKLSDAIGEIEGGIDDFSKSNFKLSSFSAYHVLKTFDIKSSDVKNIMGRYEGLKVELESVISHGDEELTQAYRKLYSMQGLRKYKDFVGNIVSDCNSFIQSQQNEKTVKKEANKPTKIKTERTSKKLDVPYLTEIPDMKLTSISPSKILGASQVWLFKQAQKHVIVLNAASDEGFSFKGATIQNVDIASSFGKRVTDVAALQIIASGTKTKAAKVLDLVRNAKFDDVSSLVNKSTLILKVF